MEHVSTLAPPSNGHHTHKRTRTRALDHSGLFLHGRVRFTGVSIVTRSADVYAPVAHLRVEGAVVEALDDTSAACSAAAEVSIKADAASWPSPTLPLRGLRASAAATTTRDVEPMRCDASCDSGASDSSRLRIAGPIAVAGIVARGSCSGCGGKSSACSSVELARTGIASSDAAAEARIVLSRLRCCLRQMGAWLDDVAFVRLYLADMGSFAAVNEVYGEAFNVPAPPARSCVEAASSEPLVSLDAVAIVRGCDCCPSPQASAGARPQCSATPRRMVLHVQSLSAWAPLCIGPYAQAVTMMLTGHGATPRRTDDRGPLAVVLAAGSIGLFPDTMRLVGAAETTTPSALLLRQGQQALLNLTHVLAAAASTDGSVSLTRSLVVTVFIAAGALPPSVGGGTDDEGRITSYSARDAAVRSLYVLVAAWVCGALPRSTASDALSSDSSEDEGEGLDEPSASAEEAPHASAVHRGASFSLEDPCDERRFRLSPSARRLPPYLEPSPSTASMATRAALTAIVDAAVGGGDSSEPESVDAANRAVQAAAYLAPLLPIHVVTVPRLPRGAVVEVEAVAVSEASTTRWRTSTASLTLQSPRGNALHLEAAPYSSDDTVDMQWRQMQRAVRQRGDTDSERVHGEHEAPSPTARPDCACTAKASVSVNCTSHTVVDGAVSSWVTIRVAEAVPDVVGDAPCAQQRAACSAQAPQPSVVAGTVASMLVQAIEAGSTSDATAVTTTIALHELLMRVYVATPAPAAAAGDAWASSFVAALESSIMSRVGEASAVRLSSDASCRKLRVSVVPVCEVSPDVESFARLSANINSASCNDPVDRTSACQGHGTTTDTQQTICHLAVHLVRYVG